MSPSRQRSIRVVLLSVLIVSVGINVRLAVQGDASTGDASSEITEPLRDARASDRSPSRDSRPVGAGEDANTARLDRLEQEVRELRRQLEPHDGMEETFLIAHSRRDLAWRVGALAQLEGDALNRGAEALGSRLSGDPEAAAAMMDLLRGLDDAGRLAVVEVAIRYGALRALPTTRRDEVLALLETGDDPARRAAAAAAVTVHFLGEPDPERLRRIEDVFRGETDADVVGALARGLGQTHIVRPMLPTLRETVRRLPAGESRGQVYRALARHTVHVDGGTELLRAFRATSESERRSEIAAAFGSAWSDSAAFDPQETDDERTARIDTQTETFLELYRGAPDVRARRSLVRSTYGLLDVTSTRGRAWLLGELLRHETDIRLRSQIERLRELCQSGEPVSTSRAREILAASMSEEPR